jgi:hypothetical protein
VSTLLPLQLLPNFLTLTSAHHHLSLPFYHRSAAECYSYLSNRVTLLVRACLKRYYDCWLVCDDPSCGRRTMQQSVKGECCRRCELRVPAADGWQF